MEGGVDLAVLALAQLLEDVEVFDAEGLGFLLLYGFALEGNEELVFRVFGCFGGELLAAGGRVGVEEFLLVVGVGVLTLGV